MNAAVAQQYSLNPLLMQGPSPLDLKQSEDLKKVGQERRGTLPHVNARTAANRPQFLQEEHLYEEADEAETREHVLGRLDHIVKSWVRSVHAAEGYNASLCEEVNAKIFTFGSYRLGVHGPGAVGAWAHARVRMQHRSRPGSNFNPAPVRC